MTLPQRASLPNPGPPWARRLALAALASILWQATLEALPPGEIPGDRKTVLILNVEQPHLPWVAGISTGIFSTFDAESPASRPDVQTEYLEQVRHPESAPAEGIWFRRKYGGQHFDAIIAITSAALAFVLPIRDESWPDTPILVLTPQRSLEGASLPPRVTGLGARFEYGRTLDLAKVLVPGTRHVAYVAEDGEGNEKWRRDLAARGLDLIDLTGLRLEQLERRLTSLPEHTVVFFESFHSDGSGRRFVPRDVLEKVTPLSNSPIFGVSATMIGHGLVGGWVLDYNEVGAEAARLTLRILRGEQVGAIPDPSTFSRMELDDRQLRRWRIRDARVPPEARVFFREPSLWGDHRGALVAGVAVLLVQGVLIAALLIARRRREDATALTDATLASLPGQVAVLDSHGKVVQVNENWASFPEQAPSPAGGVAIGANYLDVWLRSGTTAGASARKALDLLETALRGGETSGALEYSRPGADRDRWFEMHVESLRRRGKGAVVIQVDVTRRHEAAADARRRNAEIAHLNRVGAVGELASSLAHELNQPLAAILTNAQAARRLLSRASPDLKEVDQSLGDIVEDDQRAGEIIQRMRLLLRKALVPRTDVDLNRVVRDVVLLAGPDASLRRVAVAPELAPDLPKVYGDSVQLQQVVLNLVVNGMDAVASRPPGQRHVTIRTLARDASVELCVSDSGPGISEDELPKVFEAFYTTKPDGLGMGLPICRSIVEAHHGRLVVESPGGTGATFRCVLPLHQAGAP